jgi:hypothetical protein
MHDDTRRLVDDEEVLVGVGDRELRWRDGGLGRSRRRRLDLELLPTREPVALPARLPVHEDGARVEQSLGRGPRAHVR